MKDKAGLVRKNGGGLMVVRVKPFRHWVKKNAFRLMYTVAEITEEETKIEMQAEADYWEEVRRDMEEDDQREGDACGEIPSY
jgi:hypothetical protein